MLTISKPLSAGQARAYHAKEFTNSRENYYSKGAIVGQWHGRLAQSFGLVGDVDQAQFQRLAEGQHPQTGEQLIRIVTAKTYVNARGETVTQMPHRAGWDATFSAPKSVSLVALVGGDDRVREAHRQSVTVALDALEYYAQARLGGLHLPETTRQWAAATFEHDSARPVNGYSAPQLHTHAVIFNMTRTSLDHMRSIQPRELYKSQAFATAAYRTELARRLRALGYEIERGKSAQPEIKGFTKEYLEASSPRRKEIQEYLLAHGRHGADAAQIAAHQTRDPKVELSRDDVQRQHQAMASAHGHQPQQAVAAALRQGQVLLVELPNAVKDAVQYAKDRGMERSAVVQDRDVMTDAMKRAMGDITVGAVRREFERRVDVGEFLARRAERGAAARSYTTPEMVALEQATLDRMWKGQRQLEPMVTDAIRSTVPDALLSAMQRAAVDQILASRDQVTALEGIAGSGKNVVVAAVRDAAERAGYDVQGVAPTSRAAAHLAEAGMPTQTLQRLLARPDDPSVPRYPQLVILDESSLASTRLMKEFLDRQRPGDRVLLVGDAAQHQSVDAGKSYEQLQDAGMQTARLHEIVRQPDSAMKNVVSQLARGEVRTALVQLSHMGKVHAIPDRLERLQAVAADFVAKPAGTLVVAPDNQSREEINAVIHQALQAKRTVEPDHQPTRVLVVRNEMTGTDRRYADRYDVGDVIRYTKGSTKIGIAAGEYATVTATDRATNQLTVTLERGDTLTYDPERLHGVSVYHEQERSFAPGDRMQFTAPSRELHVANRQLGTLRAIAGGEMTLVLDAGRTLRFQVADHPHVDYGYAVTSHSSQGLTADRVIVHVDGERSAEAIVNQRLAYVAISRGRYDVQIYTDNTTRLGLNLTRDVSHRAAIEQPQQALTA
jgi:conjugative relaxase-like TrwC/TraI family protein